MANTGTMETTCGGQIESRSVQTSNPARPATSRALRDFVYESNKVGRVLFVEDMAELTEKL